MKIMEIRFIAEQGKGCHLDLRFRFLWWAWWSKRIISRQSFQYAHEDNDDIIVVRLLRDGRADY